MYPTISLASDATTLFRIQRLMDFTHKSQESLLVPSPLQSCFASENRSEAKVDAFGGSWWVWVKYPRLRRLRIEPLKLFMGTNT